MACDPTTITSAIIAMPISMLGNVIKTCITDVWNLEAHVEEGRRDHQLYSPVLQNAAADPPLERVRERLQLLEDQLAGQSHSSWGLLSLFKRPIRAHDIQDTQTRLRDSVLSDGIMHLVSAATSDSHSRDTLLRIIDRQYSDVRRNSHQIDRITQLLERPPAVHIMHRYSTPQVYLELSDYAVGIDDKIQMLESLLLDDAGPQLIGLFGMTGVGKSFMAALVCSRQRVKQHFRDKILWVDVSSVGCQGEVLQLQIELFSAFTGHTLMRPFASEVEGRQALCDYLAAQQERYLLVYDNVWKRSIVEPLHFELNSSDKRTNIRTMVVSRKGDLLDGSRYHWSSVKVPPLSTKDAYMLFCKHTFNGNEGAPSDMREHVYTLVKSCSGIPKLLEVIAKYVSRDQIRMQQVGFWKHVISKLHKVEAEAEDEHDKILKMMKLNYDDMKRDVQQLFLLYATLHDPNDYLWDEPLVYLSREALYYMWVALQDENQEEHEREVMRVRYEIARATLKNSFLVGMHLYGEPPLLIKELGRHIIAADKEAFIDIAERRPSVEQTTNFEVESAQVIRLRGDRICSLESATQLRVLEYRGTIDQAAQRFAFPSSLRYLSYEEWIRPSDADNCLRRLLELRFLYLRLTGNGMERLFMGLSKLSKMEFLRLDFVEKVELNLSFLGCMPYLIILVIYAPRGSIFRNLNYENLHLKVLRIGIDISLWELRHGGPEAKTTEVDRLLGCLSGESSKLDSLALEGIKITKLPSEFNFPNLKELKLVVALERFGCSGISLPRLESLCLDGCGLLSEMPFGPSTTLRKLQLTGLPGLVEIGDEFPSVSMMWITECRKLAKLWLPAAIQNLRLGALPSLVQVSSKSGLLRGRGIRMHITDCEKLNMLSTCQVGSLHLEALPSLVEIGSASNSSVYKLMILNCEKLAMLPSPLTSLHELTLKDVPSLVVEFGSEEFPRFRVSRRIEISNCEKRRRDLLPIRSLGLRFLTEIPAIGSALQELVLKGLPWLTNIGSASDFSGLQCLEISECERLAGLPTLSALKSLTLEGLPRVTQIAEFPRLKWLNVSECEGLAGLPSLPALGDLTLNGLPHLTQVAEFPRLKRLNVSECERLAGLPSLPALQDLTLEGLPRLTQIVSASNSPQPLPESTCPSWFPKLLRLQISKCEELTLLGEFPILHDLTISDCGKLARLPSLALLRHLELEASPLLVEAVSKADFPRLHSVTISAFKKVPLRYWRYLTANHQRLDTWIYPPLWRAPYARYCWPSGGCNLRVRRYVC